MRQTRAEASSLLEMLCRVQSFLCKVVQTRTETSCLLECYAECSLSYIKICKREQRKSSFTECKECSLSCKENESRGIKFTECYADTAYLCKGSANESRDQVYLNVMSSAAYLIKIVQTRSRGIKLHLCVMPSAAYLQKIVQREGDIKFTNVMPSAAYRRKGRCKREQRASSLL